MQTSHTSLPFKNQRPLEQAARAMVTAILATTWGEPDASGRREQFLKLAKGLDRTVLVQRGAEMLAADFNAKPAETERFLWLHLSLFFRWVDLATVEPRGRA
jgi:hypothetical protein